MCGIAGIFNLDGTAVAPESLLGMIRMLPHRGPDDTGFHAENGVGLAHARLSIIDLAVGQQPMCNEDSSLWITFNGEIFNYVELREELLSKGHRFATRSDTEVILHLYEEKGGDCVRYLNGQWAFAIWDNQRRLGNYGERRPSGSGRRAFSLYAAHVRQLTGASPVPT